MAAIWARRRQGEGASLGVLAYRPALAQVHDRAAELGDAIERSVHVVDLEVGQRERVAGAAAAFVDADRDGVSVVGLPAGALSVAAWLELGAQHPRPKAPCPLGVVGWELDQ